MTLRTLKILKKKSQHWFWTLPMNSKWQDLQKKPILKESQHGG